MMRSHNFSTARSRRCAGTASCTACRSRSRAWRCSIARTSSPSRRRPPTSWWRSPGASRRPGRPATTRSPTRRARRSTTRHGCTASAGASSTTPAGRRSTRDAAIASVAFVEALAAEDLLPPESTGVVAAQLFNDGRAALTINGPWFVGEIAPGVPFGVAPLPTVSATGKPAAPLVEIEALLMPARGHAPAAATAFALWLAGPRGGAHPRAHRPPDGGGARGVGRSRDRARSSPGGVPRAAGGDGADAERRRRSGRSGSRSTRRCARCCAAPPARGRRCSQAQKRVLEALRPPPPPVSRDALRARCFALVAHRARRRGRVARARARGGLPAVRAQSAAYAYLAPAAVAMVVLVFVPFAVGAGMSLFHHDAGHWTFIGLSNFIDILASRDAPHHRSAELLLHARGHGAVDRGQRGAPRPHRRDAGAAPARSAAQAARRLSRAADRAVGRAQLHHRAHLEGHVPAAVRRHQRPPRRGRARTRSPGSRASGRRSRPTSSPTSGSASRS